jgi:glycosyltransferase involved in cell wall biosynthesis
VTAKRAPRVSVVMPVYDTGAFVTAALESVSAQSFADFEIVVIDDGSTDDTLGLLEAHAVREPRMRLISRPNKGLIATRNELLAEAKGELVAWMDSDDLSLPDRLERQVAALDADPALVCVGCQVALIDPQGRRFSPENWPLGHDDILKDQQSGGGMRFPATVIRRDVALAAGGFREPFRMGEDLDFLLRVGERGRLANLPETLFLYRQHLSSTCLAYGPFWKRYRDRIVELAAERREHGSDALQRGEPVDLPPPDRREAARYRSQAYAFWSFRARDDGHRALALEFALKAIAAGPLRVVGWRALRHGLRP